MKNIKLKENKTELKPGDLIFFHNWGVGGFLFGIVIENDEKDEYYHNKLKVWRARSTFCIEEIDNIELIQSLNDVKDYALYDFHEFIKDAKEKNINFNLVEDI